MKQSCNFFLLIRNRLFVFVLLIAFVFSSMVQAQKPFKTGLVLSGGGAKGLAHVGLLELIDSLEIQVDYITGTSMGAILAGLYSVGHSADNINTIITEAEWGYILSNKLPLTLVHIDEKDDFSNQMVSLPIKNHLPTIPASFVEGQHLSELLNKYLFSARNIYDFHKLPIPLEVVAVDVLTGKKVVLNKGSLPIAIRASMAIPAFFAPVVLDDYVLVDGGLKRNFPVEEVKKMGADFVVGSYTGQRKISEEEIDNAFNTMYQSLGLDAVDDAVSMKDKTNILLDFSDPLKNFGMLSFADRKAIVEVGREEARKLLPQLIELKKKQTEAGIKFNRKKIEDKNLPIGNVNTFNSRGIPLSSAERKHILAVLEVDQKQRLDSVDYLNAKVNQLFSRLDYRKIHYTFSPNNSGGKDLNFYFKNEPATLQVSPHYDNYELGGVALRYKRNDFLLNNSKFSVGADLSQYMKTNIYYTKYLNNKKDAWAKLQYDYRRQKNNDLIFKTISQIMYFTDPSMYSNYHTINFSIGYSPDIASSLSAGIEYKYNRFRKESGVFASSEEKSTNVRSLYGHSHTALSVKYKRNTFNNSFCPTKGRKFEIGSQFFFNNNLQLNHPADDDLVGVEFYNILNPKAYQDSATAYNSVLQFWVNETAMMPLAKKVSLRFQAFAGFNFGVGSDGISAKLTNQYMFLSQKFFLGGYHNYTFDHQVPFPGLSVNELRVNNIMMVTLGMQWNAWRKLYITPNAGAAMSISHPALFENFTDNYFRFGAGVDFDYLTPLGPIKLSVNVPWNSPGVFFSFGYQF